MMESSVQMSLMNFSECVHNKDTKIKFILVTNDEILDGDLKIAHDTLLEKFPYKKNIQLMSEEECLQLEKKYLAEENVFIMEKFEGDAFHHIENMKNIFILGVKAFCTAFLERANIPTPICHVHNLSMKNTYFCFAKVNEKEKARLQKLIHYMGAQYSSSLRDCTTHLITEDVFCAKYVHANEHMMKVLRPTFVDEIWKRSQNFDFEYDQKDASYEAYNLPIFFKVNFTSTGIDLETKKNLIDAIQANGGYYDQTFKTRTTNILIMARDQVNSAKAQAAFKYKIKCVTPEWIHESIVAGFAMGLEKQYLIEKSGKLKASTPTKDTTSLGKFQSLDSTALSDITIASIPQHLTFEETQNEAGLKAQRGTHVNPSTAKRSMTLANETFKRPPTIVRETKSLAASSSVVNSISSIRSNEKENTPEKKKTEMESTETEDDESYIQILTGMNVFIYGYEQEGEILHMIKECEKFGANVVDATFNKTVDYIITNSDLIQHDEPKMKHKKIVNDVWLEESVVEGRCLEPKFHHQPLYKGNFRNVLEGEIFALSSYDSEREQPFIKCLIKNLGGVSKVSLCKKDTPILICPTPEGKKYLEGAVPWNLTTLRAEWLYECYKHKMRYDETNFLVGKSVPTKFNKKKNRDSIIPSSQGFPIDSESTNDAIAMEVEYHDNEPFVPKRVAELRPRTLESPKTPKTPDSTAQGILTLEEMCTDFPTPQREVVIATIKEGQAQINKISPRAQRQRELLKTPGPSQHNPAVEESSPMPELPEIMKPPPVDQGIRPNASPKTQWQWKMKFDIFDDLYAHKTDSMRKAYRAGLQTSPYEEKRYRFYNSRVPNYNSPDPRTGQGSSQNTMAQEAFNLFDFGESASMRAQRAEKEDKKLIAACKAHEKELRNRRRLELDDDELHKDNGIYWAQDSQPPPNYLRQQEAEAAAKQDIDSEQTLMNSSDSDENDRVNISTENSIHVVVEESQEPEALDSSGNEIDFLGAPAENDWAFAVSSGNYTEDRPQLIEKIKQLGGKTSDENFDCLIMPKIAKSSRYFCALARGLFVLHPDFVTESAKVGKFLNMESYEFGNPKFSCEILAHTSVPVEVINGPYLCRQMVLNNPEKFENGLFTGMKFIVIAAKEKRHIFCTVIEFGGGIVIDEKPEFKAAVLKREKIDNCLIDNQNALTSKDVKTLSACNIKVRNVRFIYDHLLDEIHKKV